MLRAQAKASVSAICMRYGFTVVSSVESQRLYLVRTATDIPQSTIDAILANDKDVAGLEFSAKLQARQLPSEAALTQSVASILEGYDKTFLNYYGASAWDSYVTQGAAEQIHVADAHTLVTGNATIAIIDSGVDPTHPALQKSLVPGYDFVHELDGFGSEFSDVPYLKQSVASILEQYRAITLNQSVASILEGYSDDTRGLALPPFFGHGTMVAGIVRLTAPTSKIMALKAFTADGASTMYTICRAIYYAVEHGAKIINMSFMTLTPSRELSQALAFAARNGVLTFASVGNESLSTDTYPVYPAAYTASFGIGSTSPYDHRSDFSNYGADVTIGAPGESLLTTYPGSMYAMVWGTSFSTAWASGAAALFLDRNGTVTMNDVQTALRFGAKKLNPAEGMGLGRIDIYASTAAIK
jgi:subtilisin family serine protease